MKRSYHRSLSTVIIILLLSSFKIYSQPQWAKMVSGTTKHLYDIWGTSAANVYAVGDSGTIVHYDGENWLAMNSGVSTLITKIFGFSNNEIYTLTQDDLYGNYNSVILKFDGSSWNTFYEPDFSVADIWGTSGSNLYIVGRDGGGGVLMHYKGSTWVEEFNSFPDFVDLSSIHGVSSNEIYAISGGTSAGYIYHWKDCSTTGQYSWNQTEHVSFSGSPKIWVSNENNAFAMGGDLYDPVYQFTGELQNEQCTKENWNLTTGLGGLTTLRDIFGLSKDNILICGYKNRADENGFGSFIANFDGQTWHEMTTQTDAQNGMWLNGIWAVDSAHAFAVGQNGNILQLGGEVNTIFIVNTTGIDPDKDVNDGICDCGGDEINGKPPCTLNAAIMQSNFSDDKNTIQFKIPQTDPGYNPATNSFTINGSIKQELKYPIIIDATTQDEYTNKPVIELDGKGSVQNIIVKGGNSLIKGFVINNFSLAGIQIENKGNNKIESNYIGTDISGTESKENYYGIFIKNSSENTIGGNQSSKKNVISGNSSHGIRIQGVNSKQNNIYGNFIGTDFSGTKSIENAFDGISIEDASKNNIGSIDASMRNYISGNQGYGIAFSKSDSNNVNGNFIGTDVTGLKELGNKTGGILISNSSYNVIGEKGTNSINLISGNNGNGISIEDDGNIDNHIIGNVIGTNVLRMNVLQNKGDGINVKNGMGTKISNNYIVGNDSKGIEISGSNSKEIIIRGNNIGDIINQQVVRNKTGGIYITDEASQIEIGGYEEGEANQVYDGIRIDDSKCVNIAVRNNFLEIPESWTTPDPTLPLDIADRGPTVCPWENGEGTNNKKAAPRLLDITPNLVKGMTRPNETIEIYKVLEMGVGRGRYFARKVEPLGHTQADSKGLFSISLSLTNGEKITATSTDEDGNTSELSQIKRPIVFVPGVGGSYLNGENGNQLWLPSPIAGTDSYRDNLMYRMMMNPDGSSSENITVNGILEYLAGHNISYGEIMDKIKGEDYQGDKTIWLDSKASGGSPDINTDIYRFAHDWRKDYSEIAQDLKNRIDWITSDNLEIARSVEVDIICHSNGGIVSSTYIKGFRKHSQSHIHRFIAIAIPYLGAQKAIASHTKGYIFDIDKELGLVAGFWKYAPDWSIMLQMTRNLPVAYGLIPSKLYWQASSQFNNYFLENLAGIPIQSYDELLTFFSKSKLNDGLELNSSLLKSAQESHDFTDNWQAYDGPPQVYRFAGNIPNSTPVGYLMNPQYRSFFDKRSEPGDTPEIINYRSSQVPILGAGDETVPLSSATLGRGPNVGKTDFSGVLRNDLTDNPWIEEFEYYPCSHVGILSNECKDNSGKGCLDRLIEIIKDGSMVPQASNLNLSKMETSEPFPQDLLYIFSNESVGIHLVDNEGNHSGPQSIDSVDHIEYNIPNLGYFSNDLATAISLPKSETFDISIYSPIQNADIQVVRIISNSENDYRNIIFPEKTISAGGGIQFTLQSGVTAEDLPLDIDADGDNTYEAKLNPGVKVNSTSSIPALPIPQPYYIKEAAFISDTLDKETQIKFSNTGTTDWNWKTKSNANWINIISDSGSTLSVLQVNLKSSSLSKGSYLDTLSLELSLNNFDLNYLVPVQLDIYEQRNLTSIQISPEYVSILPGDTVKFYANGYDQSGDSISFNQSWKADGGVINNLGLFIAGNTVGLYSVTVTDPSTQITDTAQVNIRTVTGADNFISELPKEYYLYNNYPNPFNPTTKIKYSIPYTSNVQIQIYNILGELVDELVNGVYTAGYYQVNWDASKLASGVYIYLLRAESLDNKSNFRNVKKMILLK